MTGIFTPAYSVSKTTGSDGAVLSDLLTPLFSQFADRYTNTPVRFIAEGEYAVVECRGQVTTKKGKLYNNSYCWVWRLTDGKLRSLTEYLDTQLVVEALTAPADSRQVTS
jgi:uncharacterized protein